MERKIKQFVKLTKSTQLVPVTSIQPIDGSVQTLTNVTSRVAGTVKLLSREITLVTSLQAILQKVLEGVQGK